jgi:hypothetical protein
LSPATALCPHCESGHTASRRQLFHQLMERSGLPAAFAWYTSGESGACPPKSLFVLLLVFAVASLLPALGLWYLGLYPAVSWLGVITLLLLVCLAFDALNTYGRYQAWSRQWVCADCRVVFTLSGQVVSGPEPAASGLVGVSPVSTGRYDESQLSRPMPLTRSSSGIIIS